jgi:cytochrome b561
MTRAAAFDNGMAAAAVYSLPARVAHWLTAVLVIIAFFIGLAMLRVGQGELQNQLFDLHRSLRPTIFAPRGAAPVVRLGHPAPPCRRTRPGAQLASLKLRDGLLDLAGMRTGVFHDSQIAAFRFGGRVVGVFFDELGKIAAGLEFRGDLVSPRSRLLFGTLHVGDGGLHIGAALYHLLVRLDSVFRRMVG